MYESVYIFDGLFWFFIRIVSKFQRLLQDVRLKALSLVFFWSVHGMVMIFLEHVHKKHFLVISEIYREGRRGRGGTEGEQHDLHFLILFPCIGVAWTLFSYCWLVFSTCCGSACLKSMKLVDFWNQFLTFWPSNLKWIQIGEKEYCRPLALVVNSNYKKQDWK